MVSHTFIGIFLLVVLFAFCFMEVIRRSSSTDNGKEKE